MAERCLDCTLDATHTLQWHATRQRWITCRFGAHTVHLEQTIHRYCQWHASVRAVARNARGARRGVDELRRLLALREHHPERGEDPR